MESSRAPNRLMGAGNFELYSPLSQTAHDTLGLCKQLPFESLVEGFSEGPQLSSQNAPGLSEEIRDGLLLVVKGVPLSKRTSVGPGSRRGEGRSPISYATR